MPRQAAAFLDPVSPLAVTESPLAVLPKGGARLMLQGAREEESMAFQERDGYERRSARAPRAGAMGPNPGR